jgi:hypothetical protein
MRRRRWLQVGLAGTAVLALAGWGVARVVPAWHQGALSPDARALFQAVAEAVLEGALPADPATRSTMLQAHLGRVELTIAGFAKPVQDEVALLLTLLATAPGRYGLAGLDLPWHEAPPTQVAASLQSMRLSALGLRQQTYQALRDITCAAFFSDQSTWSTLGYTGPMDL